MLRAFEVMVGQDIGLLKGLSAESYWDFRNNVAGCILATDFAKHPDYCKQVGPFLLYLVRRRNLASTICGSGGAYCVLIEQHDCGKPQFGAE